MEYSMNFVGKKKRGSNSAAFICLLLALGTIFVSAGVSEAVDNVDRFEKLQNAISSGDAVINIDAKTIDFPEGGQKMKIERNVTISGLDGRSTLNLNGVGRTGNSFFSFSQGLNIILKNLNFTKGYNCLCFDNGSGGAIYLNEKITAAFRNVSFSNNIAGSDGGAIHARYSDLTFSGETTFRKNSSFTDGGAIYLYSVIGKGYSLKFEGTVKFFENKSIGNNGWGGGAICSQGAALSRYALTFDGAAVFESNISSRGGGAIHARYSDLTFDGETTFRKNSSFTDGGAIALTNDDGNAAELTFQNSPPLFEGNQANQGAAIYVLGNVKIEFNSGLKLISNSTAHENSGAIHMTGTDNVNKVIVAIVQNNSSVPTEIRGNTSGNDGQNAFYLEEQAELNFILKKDDIYLYDAIGGDRSKDSNSVTIDRGEGWFNVGRGGTIRNVNLNNRGNLSLVGAGGTGLDLKDFTNSGKIKFGIFPEDKKCAKITAENITLGEGTTLELVAGKGTYEKGKTYNILIANANFTTDTENITPVPSSQNNLKIQGNFSDDRKIYHIVIEEKITIDKNPPEMRPLSQLTNLDENQDNIIDMLNDIYEINPEEENIKKLLDDLEKIKDHEDQKIAISQLSPAFIADTLSYNLIGEKQIKIPEGKNRIYLEPHLRRSDGILSASEFGATLGANYSPEGLQFLTLGMQISIHRNSLSGNYGSRANINSGGLAILASLDNRLATLSLSLGYRRNIHSVDRSAEKLEEILHSEFSSNALSFSLELGKKFKIPSYSLELYPFLGIRTATLTHGDFGEGVGGEKEQLALEIQGKRYTLLSSNFGLKLSTTLGRFTPSLSLGGSYLIVSPGREITANLRNHPDHKFQKEGADLGRFSPFLDLALGYNLPKNFNLSTEFSYSGNSSQRMMGVGFRVAMGF
jgi:predicted outer membrane repeat protein